ncbi:amidohydrolase family protein [Flaviramulus sp. BrNp1-15]|uniref:amidohydrolase family protein n=1 Tax=Flaviramulus sp. BrNp1-15 TaxID=2916754 RepID=UPI001EE83253|nr:amidohydrolase family protein [Flaviramulus sp. BrNp1-15]ULC58048.1 amidohydrolase family protein [Flaviramulus sp. BrNp1-15]
MRIDAHQHFWEFNPNRDTWIDDSMLVLQNNFLPKNLEKLLKENSFDGCIAVQADQSEEETNFLLQLSENNAFIKGVVGWVDLLDDNIEQSLIKFSSHKKFKGVRHIIQSESEGFMLQKEFLNGISKLKDFNLTYDILIYPNQLNEAYQLVQLFPEQKFVIDHIAKPPIKAGKIDKWAEDILKFSNCKNVYCKLSGIVTEANWKTWKADEFMSYLEVVFKTFGSKRLMFGSDWPVCLLAANYNEIVTLVEKYISNLPLNDQAAIMGKNALEFYNI